MISLYLNYDFQGSGEQWARDEIYPGAMVKDAQFCCWNGTPKKAEKSIQEDGRVWSRLVYGDVLKHICNYNN